MSISDPAHWPANQADAYEAQMPTQAIGYTKQLLNASMTNDLKTQLEIESKLQIASAQSEDYAEGVDAFINKRKPEFKGR